MRALILHTTDRNSKNFAEAMVNELSKQNCRAEAIATDQAGSSPVTTAQYQVVCVMSAFQGFWKPQLPAELDALLRRCSRLEGKKGVAFVTAKLGSGKALKVLMARMEQQGMIVEDFAAVRGANEAPALVKRITKLVPDGPGT